MSNRIDYMIETLGYEAHEKEFTTREAAVTFAERELAGDWDLRTTANGYRLEWAAPAVPVIHFMTGSSSVACRARMREGNRAGWDLGTVTTSPARVTCQECEEVTQRRRRLAFAALTSGPTL